MNENRSDDQLSRLLREHDPLALAPSLEPGDRLAMRRTVLQQAPGRSPSRWALWSPTVSVMTLLTLALVLAWWPQPIERQPLTLPPAADTMPTVSNRADVPTPPAAVVAADSRKIQFETPGGTLVVWVLNPNFPS